jgi:hypothetical protein
VDANIAAKLTTGESAGRSLRRLPVQDPTVCTRRWQDLVMAIQPQCGACWDVDVAGSVEFPNTGQAGGTKAKQ